MRGKKPRVELADHDVGVGDRERPAAAIAFGTRVGAGRIRPDAEARSVEMQDRAAAGRDRMDQHHRGAHAHARDLGFEGALEGAVVMRDVGRGAAHVEADDAGEPSALARPGHGDDAAAGPERIASLPWNRLASVSPPEDIMNISRARVRAVSRVARDLLDVAAQDRREIGVDDGGVAAPRPASGAARPRG